MAKNKKDVELKDMHPEELNRQIEKAKEELFKLRFRAASAPIKNTMQISQLKRDIARFHTFLNMRRQQG